MSLLYLLGLSLPLALIAYTVYLRLFQKDYPFFKGLGYMMLGAAVVHSIVIVVFLLVSQT